MTIKNAQQQLKDAGFYSGKIDGDWGKQTMDAYLRWMDSRGVMLPRALRIAATDLGLREIPGSATAKRIAQYHGHTSLKATSDEVPWCSSGMCCWWDESGIPGTNSAAARSWLTWGKGITIPHPGCVTILKRGSNPAQGHVAFYLMGDPSNVLLLGGNQGNQVSVAPFFRSQVIGFRVANT